VEGSDGYKQPDLQFIMKIYLVVCCDTDATNSLIVYEPIAILVRRREAIKGYIPILWER